MTYGGWRSMRGGLTSKNARVSVLGVETLPEAHQSYGDFLLPIVVLLSIHQHAVKKVINMVMSE